MRHVAGGAVDLGDAVDAQLHPAGRAVRAGAATATVVDHRALADPGALRVDAGTDGDYDAARSCPAITAMESHRPIARIASRGVGEVLQHDLAVGQKNDALHSASSSPPG